MNKINSARDLHAAIAALEKRRIAQELEIREDAELILDNLRPGNIIKHILRDAFSDKMGGSIFRSLIAIGSGILSRKMILGKSNNIFRRILSTAAEFGITGLIAKNADTIKLKGDGLVQKIFSRKKKRDIIENSNGPTDDQGPY